MSSVDVIQNDCHEISRSLMAHILIFSIILQLSYNMLAAYSVVVTYTVIDLAEMTANTARYRYNAVNFLQNTHHKRHNMSRPKGDVWDVICEYKLMMTSSNGNIFRVTGPLCGEFTGPGEFPT